MKITEHNITNWTLDQKEITDIIRILKKEMQQNSDNKLIELYYGLIIGKLMIMRSELDT